MQISATSPSVLALGLFITGFGLGPGTSSEIVLLTEIISKNLYIYKQMDHLEFRLWQLCIQCGGLLKC